MSEPTLLDGTKTAQTIWAEVATRTQTLKEKHGITPGLGAILAGDHLVLTAPVMLSHKNCLP